MSVYLGTKAHGNFTVGTSAVLLQTGDQTIQSLFIYNAGPGTLYVGTSAVSSSNTPPVGPGQGITLDNSADATWIVADQINTTGAYIKELAP